VEYRYLTEFQSHEPEFDYLKSLEIEEKINKIRWCQQGSSAARLLLSTNDKTIKLWKVSERAVQSVTNFNVPAAQRRAVAAAPTGPPLDAYAGRARPLSAALLRVPRVAAAEHVLAARCRRAFPNAHAYHINSISMNSDGATFLSADDLRVNLWSLETGLSSFTVVDIKPESMENLTEVITAAVFHPESCAVFAYSSSKGSIRLADMRARALCDSHAKMFEEQEAPGARSFFSEIIASISDVRFGAGGRLLLARDYLTLKLWDVAMEARPMAVFPVHEALRPKLCDLYENDAIFDKFECTMAGDGAACATGSYSHLARVFDLASGQEASVEVSKNPKRLGPDYGAGLRRGSGALTPRAPRPEAPLDYSAKLLHLAWHPLRAIMAAAAGNSLYILNTVDRSAGADKGAP